ncbi:UPF0028 protein YchK [Candidatus Syntrophocurvum alkaliphilum]|uniref:UPF0028 protein YchK n=1 Tax=Candidatus Syntrophocurvum alkaliphilum TaxID=2293317 RepID=A0A6I6DDD9_9FIRM|nr:patatin-like phospholipase family protein [Candidatus Syntrophocurvum alkaliphilum]QGT99080.1 UPF0028 protein YchK [Candidatus Syntrophocurvum alkaliphilum]
MSMKDKKVALVLGAGSAKGIAHIGVMQVLQKHNINYDLIVGTSMGAMVGGLYAAGADLNIMGKMASTMNTNILYDVKVPRLGFIAGKKITDFLNLLTKNKDFSELNLPLYVVATDLLSGEKIIIDDGSVAEAIRASISIPGIFYPVKKDGMILVDGAVTSRLPVEVAREKGADLVIAVDVTFGQPKKPEITNAVDVIMASLDILQKQIFNEVSSQADILIQPSVSHLSIRDFDKASEFINFGKVAAEEKIEEIKEKLM